MIISERKNFIFIHNPKCAGTSVRKALADYDTTGEFFWMHDTWNGKKIDKAHMPLYVFRSRFPDYFALLPSHFSFMFVRNPYDRSVSAFNEIHPELVPKDESAKAVETYTTALNAFIGAITKLGLRRNLLKYRHFVRQSDMAYLGYKRLVDVIMKVEEWPRCLVQLDIFLPDVADKIRGGEKQNTRPLKREHRSYLNRTAIETINTLYQTDFDLFDYQRL